MAALHSVMQSAPFEWPAYTGPTSTAVPAPTDWADKGLLIPHEAIRWCNERILLAMKSFDPSAEGQEWMTDAFFDWWDNYYVASVHHHHHNEEEVYNPYIIKKCEGKDIPWEGQPITGQHEELMQKLDSISNFRARIHGGEAGAVEELKAALEGLVTDMNAHLTAEEEFYPAVLRASMTQEEEAVVVEQIIQSMGLDGNKKFLPNVLYAMYAWGGPEECQAFCDTLPPPIQFFCKHWWIPDFHANQLAVLDGLRDGVKPKKPKGFLCC